MDNGDRVYWVWLAMVMGTASANLWRMSDRYDSAADLCAAIKNGIPNGLTDVQRGAAERVSAGDALKLIEKYESGGVRVIAYCDPDYPERLRWIPNPPPVIFARGDVGALSASVTVAVVGTRTPCDYSVEATRTICSRLAEAGVAVISGFERGIDIEANLAAISSGGKTAAVCGKGINNERVLGEEGAQIMQNGALIAEFTEQGEVAPVSYTERNRILCGLADGVFFAECRADSRGLDNAAHARTLGRPIFALPPADITDRRFYGQRDLIRAGAVPVFGANDILLGLKRSGKAEGIILLDEDTGTEKKSGKGRRKNKRAAKTEKKVQKNVQEGLRKSENSVTIDMSGLTERQKKICGFIADGEKHLNIIAERLELPVNVLLGEMMTLQIKNIAEELPGKRYRLKEKKG